MVAVIVITSCYLHFISYALSLTTFGTIGLHWWRSSSCVLPWVCSGVFLGVGSISRIVGGIVGNVGGGIGWCIGWSVGCRIGWNLQE
jgi:hypothetical protein